MFGSDLLMYTVTTIVCRARDADQLIWFHTLVNVVPARSLSQKVVDELNVKFHGDFVIVRTASDSHMWSAETCIEFSSSCEGLPLALGVTAVESSQVVYSKVQSCLV